MPQLLKNKPKIYILPQNVCSGGPLFERLWYSIEIYGGRSICDSCTAGTSLNGLLCDFSDHSRRAIDALNLVLKFQLAFELEETVLF